MITIKNSLIPIRGYTAMTLWPFIFVRRDREDYYGTVAERHERIHGRQQLEVLVASLGVIGLLVALSGISPWWLCAAAGVFLLWYGAEWLVRDLAYGNDREAYRNISFEQEAYLHEGDPDYLASRRPFAWLAFLGRKTWRRDR